MNTPKKRKKISAVCWKGMVRELNFAAEVIATKLEGAKRAAKDGKTVGAIQDVVRTKCESPNVPACKLDVSYFVVVGSELGIDSVIRELVFRRGKLLCRNLSRKPAPNRGVRSGGYAMGMNEPADHSSYY